MPSSVLVTASDFAPLSFMLLEKPQIAKEGIRRYTTPQIFNNFNHEPLDVTPKPPPINSEKLALLRNPVDGLKSDMISTEVERVNSSFPDRLIYGLQKSNFRIVDERKIAKKGSTCPPPLSIQILRSIDELRVRDPRASFNLKQFRKSFDFLDVLALEMNLRM